MDAFADVALGTRESRAPDKPEAFADNIESPSAEKNHAGTKQGEQVEAADISVKSEAWELQAEPRPAGDPPLACASSDLGGHNEREHGVPCPDILVRSDSHHQDGAHQMRVEGDGTARWGGEKAGVRTGLALSIEGVTLGGRGIPPRPVPMGGIHVRLPLRGQRAPAQQQGLPPRGPSPRTFHHEPAAFHREPPPSRGPPSARDMRPDFASVNSASPSRSPEKYPWQHHNHPSAEPFHTSSSGNGDGDIGDAGYRRSHHPPMNRPAVQMTQPSPLTVARPHLPEGGQRRSAYAQAMHNKRFMGSTTGGGRGGGVPGRGGAPPPAARPANPGTGYGPPRPPRPQRDPFPRFSQKNYLPEQRFRGSPPPGRWGEGFRGEDLGGTGYDFGGGSNAVGSGFDQSAMMEPTANHTWDDFCDDEDIDFPLVHTSPEWTPALSKEALGSPQRDQAQASPRKTTGAGGETRAEFIRRRGAMVGKGKGNLKGKAPAKGFACVEDKVHESDSHSVGPQPTDTPVEENTSVSIREAESDSQRDVTPTEDGTDSAGAETADTKRAAASPQEAVCDQRLEPSPLAKLGWSVGDLASRFPR